MNRLGVTVVNFYRGTVETLPNNPVSVLLLHNDIISTDVEYIETGCVSCI